MKIVSWNLNGLMSKLKNHPFKASDLHYPDVICFQEIRTLDEPIVFSGYEHFYNHAKKSNYAGTALLTKRKPLKVQNGFQFNLRDDEGRIITAFYPEFNIVNVYVPNAQKGIKGGLKRQAYRLKWDEALFKFVKVLIEKKPLILCGDFNVARGKLDYYEENIHESSMLKGFPSDEQSSLEKLLELGLCDVFRELNPTKRSYTWWSSRLNKRSEDRGWRLDYFFISSSILKKVTRIEHLSDVYGSDHCPIELEVSF